MNKHPSQSREQRQPEIVCGNCGRSFPHTQEQCAELRSDAFNALRSLVSCIRRDQGKGGILLPTEAALSHAEEVLASAPKAPRSETVAPTQEAILQAVARGWCSPNNSHKEMDSDLAFAIAVQVGALLSVPSASTEIAMCPACEREWSPSVPSASEALKNAATQVSPDWGESTTADREPASAAPSTSEIWRDLAHEAFLQLEYLHQRERQHSSTGAVLIRLGTKLGFPVDLSSKASVQSASAAPAQEPTE